MILGENCLLFFSIHQMPNPPQIKHRMLPWEPAKNQNDGHTHYKVEGRAQPYIQTNSLQLEMD